MQRTRSTKSPWKRALVGAAVGLGFLLQQLAVPVHLARHDHVYPGEPGAHVHRASPHVHDEAGHRHGREPERRRDPRDDHRPHPVADHLDQLAEPAVLPKLAHGAVAPAPAGPPALRFDGPSTELADDAESGPRPPPPRAAAAPRAPPLAV